MLSTFIVLVFSAIPRNFVSSVPTHRHFYEAICFNCLVSTFCCVVSHFISFVYLWFIHMISWFTLLFVLMSSLHPCSFCLVVPLIWCSLGYTQSTYLIATSYKCSTYWLMLKASIFLTAHQPVVCLMSHQNSMCGYQRPVVVEWTLCNFQACSLSRTLYLCLISFVLSC